MGRTYTGTESNTALGFIIGYFFGGFESLFLTDLDMVAFIHTHPQPEGGQHNDFASTVDAGLTFLPGIDEVYIVPYKKCSNETPNVIDSFSRFHKYNS